MRQAPELHNPIAQWIEPGLRKWQEAGAEVSRIATANYQIPRILYPGDKDSETILIAGTFHNEETSGAATILNPDNFQLIMQLGFSILAYPVINHWSLRFCVIEPERWLRKGPDLVNYNDGWGKRTLGKNEEVMAIEQDINMFRRRYKILCAIAMHEASDNPGVGFLYSLNAGVRTTRDIFAQLADTETGRYLASFTQGDFVQTEFGGNVRHGCIIANSKDPYSFEDWVSTWPNHPSSFVVEAPFGAPLEQRKKFQATATKAIVTSLI